MKLPFQNTYARLPERFYERISPTPVRNPSLLYWNQPLAEKLGIEVSSANSQELALVFSGNRVPEGAEPLAQAYAGHQFAHFVPQLGDGRAILLGELRARNQQLYDLQLKGSGPTRFSRRGDGRAALGPMMRECIVSEALHALGLPTTRSLALVASGEPVMREALLPGAVLTRVAASHVRVGTFEYFHARNDTEGLQILADYVIDRHYPHARGSTHAYLELLDEVIASQARLIAQWLQVGFIHGVMNTDNMALSGESIDFGPCAFMDAFDPNAVFSSIDHEGRYAYQQQPRIAQWNLTRLAECLLPLLDSSLERAKELALESLKKFEEHFRKAYIEGFARKLGLSQASPDDAPLIETWLGLLARHHEDFTIGFRALSDTSGLSLALREDEDFKKWHSKWQQRVQEEGISSEELVCRLKKANPAIIPRNHQIERAIAAAYAHADLSIFEDLLRVVQRPFDDPKPEDLVYTLAPKPEERVTETFCGT